MDNHNQAEGLLKKAIERFKQQKNKELEILYKARNVAFTKKMLASIDMYWEEAKRKWPGIYNDKVYHVQRNEISDTNILLYTIDSNYKEYVGTREPTFKASFGTHCLVDPLSVGLVVVTEDYQILVGRRKFVDTWEGFYSTVAGYVQLPKETGNAPDINAALRQEIFEEAAVKEEEIVGSDFIGLAGSSYLVFEVRLTISSSDLLTREPIEREFAKFEFIPMNGRALVKFITGNRTQIMPGCMTSLIYFGLLHFSSGRESYFSNCMQAG